MKNARERMDVLAAYREVGSYRGAAAICGTTHKTVRRIVEAHVASSAGESRPPRTGRGRNYDDVVDVVARMVGKTHGRRISAKRLLPAARMAVMRGRPATSAGWSRTRKPNGGRGIRADAARRFGRRATRWSSTGAS